MVRFEQREGGQGLRGAVIILSVHSDAQIHER